jgi:hypothetical protein
MKDKLILYLSEQKHDLLKEKFKLSCRIYKLENELIKLKEEHKNNSIIANYLYQEIKKLQSDSDDELIE